MNTMAPAQSEILWKNVGQSKLDFVAIIII